jgi:2-polyprenyl-6-hydroxyphenyl methylase/3-demethylubiquinone-9 3-methyltransferase
MSEAFAFGENWADFAAHVTPERLAAARAGLQRLIPEIAGRTFLDIGCGSGLHARVALDLGAAQVLAIDVDAQSAATARKLLGDDPRAEVRTCSVFDVNGSFDAVYSWGVLHHTGAMWKAIRHAAGLVAPGGVLAIAIYARTPLCGFWKTEKRFYAHAPRPVQAVVRTAFMGAILAYTAARGRNPVRHVREYGRTRGMRFTNDAHDWLGGHPYESASFEEVASFLRRLGLEEVRSFPVPVGTGVLGTPCNEFVYRRPA